MRLLIIAAFFFVSISSPVFAARRSNGAGQVVHSRRAPVVVHKVLPPYAGVHVYGGR